MKFIAKKILTALLLTAFLAHPVEAAAAALVNPFLEQDIQRTHAISDSLRKTNVALHPKISRRAKIGEMPVSKASSAGESKYYTIRFMKSVSLIRIYQIVRDYRYSLITGSENRLFKMEINDVVSFKEKYKDFIETVSESKSRKIDMIPDDPFLDQQWALDNMNLPEAWDITRGGFDAKVAVIDTGIYREHEDLPADTIFDGFDFNTGTPNVTSDELGHGTMVTSVISALTDNGTGMAGSCWNVSIIPYKVAKMDPETEQYFIDSVDVTAAIYLAADSGCDVINMSLGGYEYDEAEADAVSYAVSKGCLVIASSGNEGNTFDRGKLAYPASYNGVISVGSIDRDNILSEFSQYNSEVDVVAPGEGILVCGNDSGNSYYIGDGTSFSSPYVAGVAALVKTIDENIATPSFESLIRTTSIDSGDLSRDDYYGWGRIDAQKMVDGAMLPIITGIEDGGIYYSMVSAIFNKGTASLDGETYISDTQIGDGDHILIITDGDYSATYNFTVDTSSVVISGVENGHVYNTDLIITFNRGTATLNGKPFLSGSAVSYEGDYVLCVKDLNGNEFNIGFSVDKTPPAISGAANGESYDIPVFIDFDDGTATLDGTNLLQGGKWVTDKGTHTIIATDGLNTTTFVFTINNDPLPVKTMDSTGSYSDWILDEPNDTLYFTKAADSNLYCIDGTSLEIGQVIPLGGVPSDIVENSGKLYIALNNEKKIVVFDKAGKNVESEISTANEPYKIVTGGNYLYYSSSGSHSFIYKYDLDTQSEIQIDFGFDFIEPSIAINNDLNILYISENDSEMPNIYYYSLTENKVISAADNEGSYYSALFSEDRVFIGSSEYRPDTARIVCDYYSQITYAKGALLFSDENILDEETHTTIGYLTGSEKVIGIFSSGCVYTYNEGKVSRYQSIDSTVTNNNILQLLLAVPKEDIPDGSIAKQTGPDRKILEFGPELSKWVIDENEQELYALSGKDRALFFIDTETLNIDKTIHLPGIPTDIIIDSGKLYIALDYIRQILVIDIASKSIEKTLYTECRPYDIAKINYKIYYLEYDASVLYEYDLSTDDETEKSEIVMRSPVMISDAEADMLYIGQSGVSTNNLFYLNVDQNELIRKTKDNISRSYTSEKYQGEMFLTDNGLYYMGKVFDLQNPDVIIGDINSEVNLEFPVTYVGNGIVSTSNEIYDAASYRKAGSFLAKTELFIMNSKGDIFYYNREICIIAKIEGYGLPVTKDDIIFRIPADPYPDIAANIDCIIVDIGHRELDPGFEISSWIIDENDDLIVLSEKEKAVFFIDGNSFTIEDRMFFNSSPSGIVVQDGKAYISFNDTFKIEIIDIAARSVAETISTSFDPYSMAIDGNNLYYIQFNNRNGVASCIDLTTYDEVVVADELDFPSLAVNKDDHLLYLADRHDLRYFNTADGVLSAGSTSLEITPSAIFYDGKYVYLGDDVYDPFDPSVVVFSMDDETTLFAKNGFIFTGMGFYDNETFSFWGEFLPGSSLFEMSSFYDLYAYDETTGIITRMAGEPQEPVITGVVDGQGYFDEVTITFDTGTAQIDGLPFASGNKVTDTGKHTLVITDFDGYETIVTFYIYDSAPDDNIIITIPDDNFKLALIGHGADIDMDNEISRGEMRVLTGYLDLAYQDINDITGLEFAVNIKYLEMYGNNISDLTHLANLTGLEMIDASYNDITDISPLGQITDLSELYLDSNAITDLSPLALLSDLTSISLYDNLVEDITAFEGKDGIVYLDLATNAIDDISPLETVTFDDPYSMEIFSDYHTKSIGGAFLDLSGNPFTDLNPLAGKSSLQVIYLQSSAISDYSPLETLPDLLELDLSDNSLSDIEMLTEMTYLESLYLDNNNIEDISVLENFTGLYVLTIANNRIRDISSLQYLSSLFILDLANNYLYDISALSGIESIFMLDVSGNYLDLDEGSDDMAVIDAITSDNEYSYLIYEPQNDPADDILPGTPRQKIINDITWDYTPLGILYCRIDGGSPLSGTLLDIPVTIDGRTVIAINANAFEGSSGLEAVEIPSGVATIGTGAFASCGSLSAAYFAGPPPDIDSTAYTDCASDFKVYYHISQEDLWNGFVEYPSQPFCKVSVNLNNGSQMKIEKTPVSEGKIISPATPVREGYTFGGWYKESACIIKWDFGTSVITGDIAIYAKWTINKFTITYNSQGGSTINPVTVDYADHLIKPADPVRNGYIFGGWYRESSCINEWRFSSHIVTTEFILYAKWTLIEITSETFYINKTKSFISGIRSDTTVKTILDSLSNSSFIRIYKGETQVSDATVIGTGMTARLMSGNTILQQLNVVVTGDMTGDGKITGTDFIKMKAHLLGKTTLNGAYAAAADINASGGITGTDYIKLKAHLLGKEIIQPKEH